MQWSAHSVNPHQKLPVSQSTSGDYVGKALPFTAEHSGHGTQWSTSGSSRRQFLAPMLNCLQSGGSSVILFRPPRPYPQYMYIKQPTRRPYRRLQYVIPVPASGRAWVPVNFQSPIYPICSYNKLVVGSSYQFTGWQVHDQSLVVSLCWLHTLKEPRHSHYTTYMPVCWKWELHMAGKVTEAWNIPQPKRLR